MTSPIWNEYKKKLKHDEDNYDFEGLQHHLRKEEDSYQAEAHSKANNVEEGIL